MKQNRRSEVQSSSD